MMMKPGFYREVPTVVDIVGDFPKIFLRLRLGLIIHALFRVEICAVSLRLIQLWTWPLLQLDGF